MRISSTEALILPFGLKMFAPKTHNIQIWKFPIFTVLGPKKWGHRAIFNSNLNKPIVVTSAVRPSLINSATQEISGMVDVNGAAID